MLAFIGVMLALKARTYEQRVATVLAELSATETRANYLYRGVANRGYVELCKNADGEIGVWFTDECQQENEHGQ